MYTTTQKITILASLLSFLTLTPVLAQEHNVTVSDTSPFITYTGQGTGDAPICKLAANGNPIGGQPGCYLIPSQCTSSVAMSQNLDHKASASFQFNGTAIYINSALSDVSPLYTVTLDGKATDVDGVRNSTSFICASLFSQTGLSPTVPHNITLSVKGPSPSRNMTQDPNGTTGVFSLIEFLFTDPGSNSTSSNTSSSASQTSTSSRPNSVPTTPTNPNSIKPFDSAAIAVYNTPSMLFSGVLTLGIGAILGICAL